MTAYTEEDVDRILTENPDVYICHEDTDGTHLEIPTAYVVVRFSDLDSFHVSGPYLNRASAEREAADARKNFNLTETVIAVQPVYEGWAEPSWPLQETNET